MSIYADFVEFREDDRREPTDPTGGTIYAVDTNVLLNLFKFTPATRNEVLGALSKMAPALFVPHQVVKEFWGALDEVTSGRHHQEAISNLTSYAAKSQEVAEKWRLGAGLTSDTDQGRFEDMEQLRDALAAAFDGLINAIEEMKAQAQEGQSDILVELERILDGRVGRAPEPSVRQKTIAEFESRVKEENLPGARDLSKGVEKAASDFLIWRECVDAGKARKAESGRAVDLTLITNDLKDDWVRTRRSADTPLALRTLVREYADTAGGVFRIRTFLSLLDIARTHFGAQVSDASLAQVEVQSRAEGEWTDVAIAAYLRWLHENGYEDQLRVLLAAAILAAAGNESLSQVNARAVARRDRLGNFSTPYKTALRDPLVQDTGIVQPMLWFEWDNVRYTDGRYELQGVDAELILSAAQDDQLLAPLLAEAERCVAELSVA